MADDVYARNRQAAVVVEAMDLVSKAIGILDKAEVRLDIAALLEEARERLKCIAASLTGD